MTENNFTVDVKNKLIIEKYSGEFTIQKFKTFKQMQYADPNFNKDYNILSILSETTIEISIQLACSMVDFLKLNQEYIGNRKTAILASTPLQTAASFLLTNKADLNSLEIKTFSTLDAAMKWLEIIPENLERPID